MAWARGVMRSAGRSRCPFQDWLLRMAIPAARDITISLSKGLPCARPFSFQASRDALDLGERLACLPVMPVGISVAAVRRKSREDIDAWAVGRDSPYVRVSVTHGTRPDLITGGLPVARSHHANMVYGHAGTVRLAHGGTSHLPVRLRSDRAWCTKLLHKSGGLARWAAVLFRARLFREATVSPRSGFVQCLHGT